MRGLQNRGTRMRKGTAGAGARGILSVSQTGTRGGAPPMLSTQAPGARLLCGHEAPNCKRPPRPAVPALSTANQSQNHNASRNLRPCSLVLSRGASACSGCYAGFYAGCPWHACITKSRLDARGPAPIIRVFTLIGRFRSYLHFGSWMAQCEPASELELRAKETLL